MKRNHIKKQVLVLIFLSFTYLLFPQTFTEQTGISIPGVYLSTCDWGDYDNDGDLDILLTGFTYATAQEKAAIYRNNGNNTFTEMTGIILTGIYFSDAAWGDYDNDGDLDILLTGSSSTGNISKVYRNNGNSTFTEQTSIVLTGVSIGTCTWCDYDNDGDLDILITGITLTGSISKIYQNNGNNTFTEQTSIRLPGLSYGSVAWGDYNNDNFPDLLMTGLTNNNQRVSRIFRNNGDNSFTEQTSIYLTGVFYSSAAWGDYDNDGDLDIVITGAPTSGQVSIIYRNEGNNIFVQQSGITLPGVSNGSVAWGDCDNDGDLDLLLSGSTGTENICRIYRNNGNNTFTERTDIALQGIESGSVAWGDYDSDNDLDILLTGNTGSTYISKIYRSSGLSANIRPSAPIGLISSWDNDHITFRWNRSTDNNTPANAINYNLRIGTTSGGNQIHSSQALAGGKLLLAELNSQNNNYLSLKLPLNRYYWSVQAVDKDVTGSIFSSEQISPTDSLQAKDLRASIKSSSSLLIRWTNGNGLRRALFGRLSSSAGRANPLNGLIYKAEPYFGNGDQLGTSGWFCMYNGKADSVLIYGLGEGYSYDLQVVEYIETGGLPVYFKTLATGNPGVFSSSLYSEQTGIGLTDLWTSSVDWADFDNDGYLDIINTGNTGTGTSFTKIYKNNGNNTFSEQTGISFPANYLAADIADYDNDSDLDILLINRNLIINQDFKIFRNNGNNTFTELTANALGVSVSCVAPGDYNNDGFIDLLMTGNTSSGPVTKIYKNNGDNTFTEQTGLGITGVYEGSVAWGDYNNDGYLDIVLTGKISSTQFVSKIFRNNGGIGFTEQTSIFLTGVFSSSVAWGDYDNDGDLDLLIAGSAYSYYIARIYRNNGDNTFSWQTSISLPAVNQCSVAWGDYNNDGYLDILLTGYSSSYGSISRIYRNSGKNSFTEVTGISLTGVSNNEGVWGDYDNDGDLDIMIGTRIYRNNTFMKAGSYTANRKPSAPLALSSVSQPDGMKLNWSPVKTDETSFKALSYNIKIGTSSGGDNILAAHADRTTGYRRFAALGNVQSDTSHIIKGLPSGRYYWSVQAIDQGYKGGDWSSVNFFDVKTVQAFFKADTVCLGLPTHFTDQSVTTDGIASWKWDFKDGTTSSSQNPVHTFSGSGTLNVKLVIKSNGGVKDSLEKSIIVKPKPVTDFSASAACQGTETVLTNLTNISGLNITSWSWDFGDGKGSTFQNPGSHGYLSAGDYQLTLTANADNGCSGTIMKTVSVGAYPVAAITANAPLSFCAGDSVILSVGSNSQYSYVWMLNNTGITNAIANIYTAKLSGNYSVEVTNTKGSCKTTSSQVAVTKLAMPATPVIVTQNYQEGKCPGENQIVLSVDQPVIEYAYQWKRNGTPISNATVSNYSGFLSAGDYSVTVSQSGCKTESAVKTIVYDNAPPKPLIYIHGPNLWYLASSIADPTQYKYRWYYNGNLIPGADKYIYVANHTLGDYCVTIENTKGCYTSSDVIKIPTGNVSIEETDPFASLKIYPNPSPGQFVVEMDNQAYGEFVISVLAQGGRQVLSTKFEKTTEHFDGRLDLSSQPKGIYIINMAIEKYFATRKVVVE